MTRVKGRSTARWPLTPLTRTAIAVFVPLAVVHTWPMLSVAGSQIVDLGDGMLNAWLLSAVSQRLFAHPFTLFDVNMYYPYQHALASLDHQLSALPITAPVWWLTGDPLLVMNLFTIATFALAGIFTARLVADLTGSTVGALVAGCIYAFSTMRFEDLNHTHLLGNCWLPLALLTLHRYMRAQTWASLWRVTASILLLALASWYYAVIGALAVLIIGAPEAFQAPPPRRRLFGRAAVGAIVIVLVLGGVARAYVAITRDYVPQNSHTFTVTAGTHEDEEGPAPIDRSAHPSVIQRLSAPVESYVGVAPATRAPWLAPLRSISPGVGSRFFPGAAAALLALLSIALLVRAELRGSRLMWLPVGMVCAMGALLAAAVIGPTATIASIVRPLPAFFAILLIAQVVWLLARASPALDRSILLTRSYFLLGAIGALWSFGSDVHVLGVPLGTGVYPASWPPFSQLRMPARFGILFLMGAAVLAGFGYATLARAIRGRVPRYALAIVALLLVNVELTAAPLALQRFGRIPQAYLWLKNAPPGPVVDFPIHTNGEALYWALYHQHPVANGYGMVEPVPYQRLKERDHLSPEMLAHIRAYVQPRYLVINRDKYTGEDARVLNENLAKAEDQLRPVGRFATRDVFEVGGPSRGSLVLRVYQGWMLSGKQGVAVRAHLAEPPARGEAVVEVWGNGQLLGSKTSGDLASSDLISAALPPETSRGLNLEVMADYTLPPSAASSIGGTGRSIAADIALSVTPERTRLEVNGHVWLGHKGYTVIAFGPDGRRESPRGFNTSWSEDESRGLAAYLQGLPAGTTIAIASGFDASRSLTAEAVRALSEFGIASDLRGRFRWAHAAIGVKGAPAGTALESVGESAASCRIGSPAPLTVVVDDVSIR